MVGPVVGVVGPVVGVVGPVVGVVGVAVTPAGTTRLEMPEKSLDPAAFTARTQKEYATPLVRYGKVSEVSAGPATVTSTTIPVSSSSAWIS